MTHDHEFSVANSFVDIKLGNELLTIWKTTSIKEELIIKNSNNQNQNAVTLNCGWVIIFLARTLEDLVSHAIVRSLARYFSDMYMYNKLLCYILSL